MYRRLQAPRLLSAIQGLVARIEARFPDADLARVAGELREIATEAAARAESIRRPITWLRFLTGSVLLAAAVLLVLGILSIRLQIRAEVELLELIQASEAALGSTVFLGAAGVFLLTLENRIKRRRALSALHELHAIAHIIDMHQLSKDPELLLFQGGMEKPTKRPMTLPDLARYLDYCSDLLSYIAKVGALYVQGFPDGISLAAVDDLEDLTSGLSQKVWQKIMILEQIAARALDARSPPDGGGIEV